MHNVLDFLQQGLDISLSLGTLKCQISAISAFYGTRWALHALVIHFFQAVRQIKPSKKFPIWDRPLVLEFLILDFFWTSNNPILFLLTITVAFYVAVTLASRVS